MTTDEFDLEFDLLYNNINSNLAPGINALEKSMFLTQAQDMFVKSMYEVKGFEDDESIMQALAPLVKSKDYSSGEFEDDTNINRVQIAKPKDMLYIVYEGAEIENGCSNKFAEVLPVKHDDINKISKNPFRGASKNRVLRTLENNSIVIISKFGLSKYSVVYIEKPSNIVLKGAAEFGVEGYTKEAGCILPAHTHRTILMQAVELAQSAWK